MQEEQFVPEPNTFPIFSTEFILRPHLVTDHSNKTRKQMEDFIYAFNKRIEAETTYQKNLYDCAKLLEKYIDPTSEKCLSYISSAFKVDNEQRGNQAKELADSLKTEVVDPMSESLKNFTALTKKAEKNFKKLNKDYFSFSQNYERARSSFYENDNELKEMIISKNIYKYTSQFSQEKKNKLIMKTMEAIREKTEYQKLYKSSVRELNEIIQLYQKQGTELLNELEQAQREQIKLESDAIRKLIVCEVSMFKNVEYDLINISKQMEKMYAENDIQAFKKEANSLPIQQQKDRDMSLKTVQFDKSLMTQSLKNVEQDYHAWLLGIKKNKALRKVMEYRMKELTPQNSLKQEQKVESEPAAGTTQPQVEQSKVKLESKQSETASSQWHGLPKQMFNPPPNPNGSYQKLTQEEVFADFQVLSEIIQRVWCRGQNLEGDLRAQFIGLLEKNHMLRVLAYLFIEQFRIEHRVLMSWGNYEKAAELARVLIEQCDRFNDVFTLKGILALIFTFYSIKDEKSKRLLYQQPIIVQSDIWKREDYWEASIFESTYEQMANFSVQKGETHSETLLREKNIIFSQLASYCHYMLMLGTGSKNVRRIVGRYCRLYEMTEEQNKDLSKMISNTTKQLKELNAANSPPTSTADRNSMG